MVLLGSEVKAIRENRCNLKDSFARVIKGEIFLLNAHISVLNTTNAYYKHDETRSRKLLLKRKDIDKIDEQIKKDGLTLMCLDLHLSNRNYVKATIALAKGKKLYDKRESLKEKDIKRSIAREMKRYN